jgi:ankyrin repeat protein
MEEDMIMHRAIRNGDEAAVIRLLEADPALLERWDGFGHRPLTLAASIRGIWAARLLIQKGANINGSTCDGGTALHQAARRDDEQMAILLLRHGAQANSTDDNHMTPLMLACRRNSVGVVKLLLQHTEGQGLEQRDRDGCTALFHAAKLARLEVIALLLNEGAHANAANRIGRTPLMAASTSTPLGVVHGTVGRQAVQMLSEQMKGQGLDERDCEGLTALHLAAGHGNMAAVRGLLLAGADPTITDRSGRSPHAFAQKVMDDGEYYEHAAKWQLTSCMAMLQASPNMCLADPNGWTASTTEKNIPDFTCVVDGLRCMAGVGSRAGASGHPVSSEESTQGAYHAARHAHLPSAHLPGGSSGGRACSASCGGGVAAVRGAA